MLGDLEDEEMESFLEKEFLEESSDEDDTEDLNYERRHQPFEQLERLGYELMASSFGLMARCAVRR